MDPIVAEAIQQFIQHLGDGAADAAGDLALKELVKRSPPALVVAAGRLENLYKAVLARLAPRGSRPDLGAAKRAEPAVHMDLWEAAEAAITAGDDTDKTDLLAELLADRMTVFEGSSDQQYLSRAIRRVRDLSPNQIRLLALISIISDPDVATGDPAFDALVAVGGEAGDQQYLAWLDHTLGRLGDARRDVRDLEDLEAQGLIQRVRRPEEVFDVPEIRRFRMRAFGAPFMDAGLGRKPDSPLFRAETEAGVFDTEPIALATGKVPIASRSRLGCFDLTPLGATLAGASLRAIL